MDEDLNYEAVEARDSRNVEILNAYLAETPDAVLAASYLEPETGLTWVGFAGEASRHEQALRERLPEPDSLRVFSARYSEEQLKRIHDAIRDLPDEYGVVAWGTDVAANRVEVLANPPVSPELIKHLRERFGDAVIVEEGTVGPA